MRFAGPLLAVVILLGAKCAAAQSPASVPSPALSVVGQVLTVAQGYLVFTTGDAVKLDPALRLPKLRLAETIRVRIDRATKAVIALERLPRTVEAADLEAGKIPRELVVAAPKSARRGSFEQEALAVASHPVTVTINVRVPDSTPVVDDVYLATDRTNFAPAEIRMLRVDARTFTVALQLQSGTQLRYEFTRGLFATIERNKLGGIVTPRPLTASDGLKTDDVVVHWADL